jgi:hypothetical protein
MNKECFIVTAARVSKQTKSGGQQFVQTENFLLGFDICE